MSYLKNMLYYIMMIKKMGCIITEEKKQNILQDFLEYLEKRYDKQILFYEIFWEMDDYYRERGSDILYVTMKEVEDFLQSKGWEVNFYN